MRIAESRSLRFIAKKLQVDMEVASGRVVESIKEQWPELYTEASDDDYPGHGLSLIEILEQHQAEDSEDRPAITMMHSLAEGLGFSDPGIHILSNIADLVLIGDGDCPQCGRTMICIDKICRVHTDPEMLSEPAFEILSEVKSCPNCRTRVVTEVD